ncbi:MAG: flagellar basal body P-ring protein FlgI [Pedosphaera sp.]|nr:flagellar basal body P-ring protein FlgI [Pedosphaera sp.]MSU43219.1 flagellar basal body P-ring protein FlgI [Pedosphaera sp.]
MKKLLLISLLWIAPGIVWAQPAPTPAELLRQQAFQQRVNTGVRVKDLAYIHGARDNQLMGYGLVVGLNNTGDKDTVYSKQSIANVLQRYGITVPASAISAKNVAAVLVTADIPPFMKNGARIDVVVSALGDATTLTGGVLIQTPLLGADDKVYAVAQGPVSNNSLMAATPNAAVTINHPTTAQIIGGALVERVIPVTLIQDNAVDFVLRESDFSSTSRMAFAINEKFPLSSRALDGNTVRVEIPLDYLGAPVDFIAQVQQLRLMPDTKARVVINERTGTIVATAPVRVSACAIAQGSIVITIAQSADVSQPNPAGGGQTVTVPADTVTITEGAGRLQKLVPFGDMPTVEEVATSLNALQVSPRDMMAIFQALKQAGALNAELIIK